MPTIEFEFRGETLRVIENELEGSDFCTLGWSPYLVTGLLRQLLIYHFSDPQRIEHPLLKKFLWDDSENSPILIETVYRWRPDQSGKRPALLVRREAFQNQRLSIADALHGRPTVYGQSQFSTLWTGSLSVLCISREGTQCEILASEVQRFLTETAAEIISRTGLLRFRPLGLSGLAQLREYAENYVVSVSIECGFEERWTGSLVKPRLAAVYMQGIQQE